MLKIFTQDFINNHIEDMQPTSDAKMRIKRVKTENAINNRNRPVPPVSTLISARAAAALSRDFQKWLVDRESVQCIQPFRGNNYTYAVPLTLTNFDDEGRASKMAGTIVFGVNNEGKIHHLHDQKTNAAKHR
jgi:hypothetical protein